MLIFWYTWVFGRIVLWFDFCGASNNAVPQRLWELWFCLLGCNRLWSAKTMVLWKIHFCWVLGSMKMLLMPSSLVHQVSVFAIYLFTVADHYHRYYSIANPCIKIADCATSFKTFQNFQLSIYLSQLFFLFSSKASQINKTIKW